MSQRCATCGSPRPHEGVTCPDRDAGAGRWVLLVAMVLVVAGLVLGAPLADGRDPGRDRAGRPPTTLDTAP